jgi:hypothetical protein
LTDVFYKLIDKPLTVNELSVVANDLWPFGTELKSRTSHRFSPAVNGAKAWYLVVRYVEFDGVELAGVVIQKVFFFGVAGINLTNPFFIGPNRRPYETAFLAIGIGQYALGKWVCGREAKVYANNIVEFTKIHDMLNFMVE